MILESLYCGNICPADQAIPLDKEYQKLRQKILKGLEELESKLTPEQMKLVNQFHSDVISSHCMGGGGGAVSIWFCFRDAPDERCLRSAFPGQADEITE